MKNGKRSKISTKALTQAGFLVAISIVLTRFASILVPLAGGLPALRVGFGEIPLIMGGLIFGPLVGGIGGAVADLIGAWAFPQGPYFPGFTLSSILWGVIPGLFGIYFRKANKGNPFSLKNVFITVAISILIISIGLNTYWLAQMFGKGFMAFLPGRVLSALVNIPLQSYIITLLIKNLKTIIAL